MEHLEFCERLTALWVHRAESIEIKPKSAKYRTQQLEFFLGACSAMNILHTTPKAPIVAVVMALSVGRDSRDVWPGYIKYMKANEEPAQKDPETLDPKSG